MKKKKLKRKAFRRFIILLPTTLVILTALVIFVGKYWVQIIDKYRENEQLNQELIKLKEEENKLSVDVEKLEDPDYIARYAREKYLFSKDGEIIIKIPD